MVNDMKRTLVLGALIGSALLVATVSGCGGHPAKKTSLELVADGFGSKAVFHLLPH
jgi:hypothetical protein